MNSPVTEHEHDLTGLHGLWRRGMTIWREHIKYVCLYLMAIVAANLIVARFGAGISKVTAFLFVGLDFTAMDHLHDAWHRRGLWWKMALLIASGSALSWLLNRNAGRIGMASFVAFVVSGIVDRLIYAILVKRQRHERVDLSNLGSSAIDSFLFPTLAFGWPPDLDVIFGQFTAKMAGGAVWRVVLGWNDE
jgi:uncharacterized PurR-regulated membrane protein YhhQ (DUF165 family)